mmetsp:Transcript_25496/g.58819  ORF Transcript_25496/g.58819 Transcript_25496/m.58819 type:complete len:231 (+) Transcript_25496:2938-3630(+)
MIKGESRDAIMCRSWCKRCRLSGDGCSAFLRALRATTSPVRLCTARYTTPNEPLESTFSSAKADLASNKVRLLVVLQLVTGSSLLLGLSMLSSRHRPLAGVSSLFGVSVPPGCWAAWGKRGGLTRVILTPWVPAGTRFNGVAVIQGWAAMSEAVGRWLGFQLKHCSRKSLSRGLSSDLSQSGLRPSPTIFTRVRKFPCLSSVLHGAEPVTSVTVVPPTLQMSEGRPTCSC